MRMRGVRGGGDGCYTTVIERCAIPMNRQISSALATENATLDADVVRRNGHSTNFFGKKNKTNNAFCMKINFGLFLSFEALLCDCNSWWMCNWSTDRWWRHFRLALHKLRTKAAYEAMRHFRRTEWKSHKTKWHDRRMNDESSLVLLLWLFSGFLLSSVRSTKRIDHLMKMNE